MEKMIHQRALVFCRLKVIFKKCKWYIRLFFHVITQTILINLWRIYCPKHEKISFLEFWKQITMELINSNRPVTPSKSRHQLEKAGPSATTKKRCHGFQDTLKTNECSDVARKQAKRVNIRCKKCNIHFCLECFTKIHKLCF